MNEADQPELLFQQAVGFVEKHLQANFETNPVVKTLSHTLARINFYALLNGGFHEQFWEKYVAPDTPLLDFLLTECVLLNLNLLTQNKREVLIDYIADAFGIHNQTSKEPSLLPEALRKRLPKSQKSKEILKSNFWLVYLVLFYSALKR